MAKDFSIPKVGEGVDEVTIAQWLVEDGSRVEAGDDVLEVETDKATVPIKAEAAGYIHIGPFEPGTTVPIEEVVATIGGEDEGFAPGSGDGDADETQPEPQAEQAEAPPQPQATSNGSQPGGGNGSTPEDVRVTPVAARMARDLGVDLSTLSGSGMQGRITKADVLGAASPEAKEAVPQAQAPQPTPPASEYARPDAPTPPKAEPAPTDKEPQAAPPQPQAQPTPEEDVLERIPLKGIRGVIARRMAESVQTTARVTLVTEVDATELVTLRTQLKAKYAEAWGFSPGYNELLGLIVTSALREFPYMNARFAANGESIEYLQPVNLGMAVDTDRGLLVAVLKNADNLGLHQFGADFRELVQKVRSGKAGPEELSGSTFTISNLGTYRVDAFTPVINLPEAAILGVGRIQSKPVARGTEIAIRQMMTLSLVFDHRLVDGAPAARFLDYVCELVEDPALLFLNRR